MTALQATDEDAVARSAAASPERGRKATIPDGRGGPTRLPGLKATLFGVVLLSLLGFVAVALVRELGTGSATSARTDAARPVIATPRPALTAAEEGYAQALWPIHNEVKASALKMSMAGIQYKTKAIDATRLKAEVAAQIEVHRRAEGQILALQPPPSFQGFHDEYLRAVHLYQQAGAEMVKLYDDNRDDHLVAAFPLSQEGGQILRRVGGVLWPNEYVPN